MKKIDLKKDMKHLYQPSAREVVIVDVPTMNFLMVDGESDPNTSPVFANAVEALFTVAYAIKFIVKKGPLAIDYGVMPLEGLWWVEDMSTFDSGDKSQWQWTVMIMQPAFVPVETIDQTVAEVQRKKNPALLDRLRLGAFSEGRCAQNLHIGPFSEEGPTVAKIHRFIDAQGTRTGKHHEIYLSDIRKASPEKWKTIIRQPMG